MASRSQAGHIEALVLPMGEAPFQVLNEPLEATVIQAFGHRFGVFLAVSHQDQIGIERLTT